MFRTSGTHHCNLKFPKISLNMNELEFVTRHNHNATIPMHSLETLKMKKYFIKTIHARELVILVFC